MKILAITSVPTISQESLKKLKERIKREDLFAICYAIEWPKNAKDYPGRMDVDENGIIFADSFKDYRSKIHAIVEPSGCPESSFRFYTVYNVNLSSSEYVYYTYFHLQDPVLDSRFLEAQNYLLDITDHLTEILRDDISELSESLVYVQWDLEEVDKGCIYLVTTDALSSDELDKVSQWVRDQNADGVGESFEQIFEYNNMDENPQYYDSEDLEDPDMYEECWYMPEFDWKWNNYKFKSLK